ncbi:hypothetical protein HO133_004370 [Letharia lupina]|uniref:Fatty acid hydroxylase domain-containing protein n=1 Tax=Letharia lupina TaxID=560253 RepID=A0A8H6FK81_9LECA|nr:uncharacterized protein HO133_004370 [Letharia lupina]KAF6230032.1 hypothetical protein HO133_004370 [Letharia lupina]
MFAADTWQYFGHHLPHTDKWVYKNIHSIHHRLYLSYSYGAAFMHPSRADSWTALEQPSPLASKSKNEVLGRGPGGTIDGTLPS